MKDVTPKKGAKSAGGHRPATKFPAPRNAPSGGTSGKKSTAVAVHQPQPPKNVLQVIAEAASNPAVNPSVMRELLDMQKEIVAEERKQSFDAAFIALQAELPVIGKDGRIEIREKDAHGGRTGRLQQATPYATFEAIMDAIQPLLTKHGFGLSFETQSATDRLLVRGHLIGHGHERHTEFPLPAETSGSKNNVQGWGSSMSYGKRYCTIALLNIRSRALQDADTDGFPGDMQRAKGGGLAEAPPKAETLTDKEAEDLRDLMDDCDVGADMLCGHFGIAKVADLPRELLKTAIKDCHDYKANQARKRSNG